MPLTVVSPYGAGGASTRVRVNGWLRHLKLDAQHYEYLGAASSAPTVLGRRPADVMRAERALAELSRRSTDTLLLQREASPLSRGTLETRLLRNARHAVYDFDDALQWDHGDGGFGRKLAPKAPKCLAAVRAADVVIAGNDLLAEWASQWARHVVVIPSCVEPAEYLVKSTYELQDPPRLGWLGSASAESHLLVAAEGLLEVNRRTGARLTVLSSGTRSLGSLDGMVDRVPWGPSTFARELASWDVAIAPLADRALARGKCAYKLLQYAAAGVPAVGSPVGVNRSVLASLRATAAQDDGWADAIGEVLGSDRARVLSAEAARRGVHAGWSYGAWATEWTSAVGCATRRQGEHSRDTT